MHGQPKPPAPEINVAYHVSICDKPSPDSPESGSIGICLLQLVGLFCGVTTRRYLMASDLILDWVGIQTLIYPTLVAPSSCETLTQAHIAPHAYAP